MALVEETASYLDGEGRQDSKKLERSAALAYATESMRLTTRLMQLASWLLLHRAVKEGEMSLSQANKEKTKVKLSLGDRADADTMQLLPERLRDLIDRSLALLDRVRRLDATMHSPIAERRAEQRRGTPARPAQGRLRARGALTSLARPKRQNPACGGVLAIAVTASKAYFLPRPPNFFWKRESRPPRSIRCCWPPVQAGCDFGSMSSRSVSPDLPQVVRVVNSVPSVMTTLTV